MDAIEEACAKLWASEQADMQQNIHLNVQIDSSKIGVSGFPQVTIIHTIKKTNKRKKNTKSNSAQRLCSLSCFIGTAWLGSN